MGWNSGGDFGPVEPAVSQVVARAATALAEAGCQVEEVTIPGLTEKDTQWIHQTIYTPESVLYLEPKVAGRERELTPDIRARLARTPPSLREFLEAQKQCEALRQDVKNFLDSTTCCFARPVPTEPSPTVSCSIP